MATHDNPLAVTGPFRVHVHPTPSGVKLDVSHYLQTVLVGIAQAAAEDPEVFTAELVDIADLSRRVNDPDGHARHELDTRIDALLAEVADDCSIDVYGQQVHRLIERLTHLAQPRPVPEQTRKSA
ncbi:hypothetical protein [Streptomyces chilikensis]|uniref:Uncharacterized protein n=1 Tax=Streptomyces chilikensis TaxID=1194079 RepID=A0ABV3EJ55_9ACTN